MTTIKARLNCSRLGSDGMYPLVIRIIHERVKREVCTPYRLRPEEFEVCSEMAVTKSRGIRWNPVVNTQLPNSFRLIKTGTT